MKKDEGGCLNVFQPDYQTFVEIEPATQSVTLTLSIRQ